MNLEHVVTFVLSIERVATNLQCQLSPVTMTNNKNLSSKMSDWSIHLWKSTIPDSFYLYGFVWKMVQFFLSLWWWKIQLVRMYRLRYQEQWKQFSSLCISLWNTWSQKVWGLYRYLLLMIIKTRCCQSVNWKMKIYFYHNLFQQHFHT